MAGRLADHIQLALERIGHHHVRAAADEDLADHRFLGAHRRRHRHLGVGRHIAPAEDHLAFGSYRALDLLLAGQARCVLLRQEHHADPEFAGRRQLDALLRHLFPVVLVRHLDQDAGAVAHQLVGTDRTAVIEVLQDQQTLFDDRMAFLALDMGDETDAAGIVFIGRVVHTLRVHSLLHCFDGFETGE